MFDAMAINKTEAARDMIVIVSCFFLDWYWAWALVRKGPLFIYWRIRGQ